GVNRVLGRCGRVWSDRFHARPLRTPREVRNGLIYVLQNWQKHVRGARGFDWRSSAIWFGGWQTPNRLMPGTSPGGRTTDVACGDWLAPPRPDSCRRAAGVDS